MIPPSTVPQGPQKGDWYINHDYEAVEFDGTAWGPMPTERLLTHIMAGLETINYRLTAIERHVQPKYNESKRCPTS